MVDPALSLRRFLVAPDSFKGTFAAPQVAGAIARGVRSAGLGADECPVADGGEGTLDALLGALGGEQVSVDAHDPLGRPVAAAYGVIEDGATAIVEMARASGLGLVAPAERDPWRADTRGTGELIVAAARRAGVRRILIAVGGSATVDGGAGALAAIAEAGGLHDAELVVLCDVQTPWERCAEVYGPQKGADAAMVARLAQRLDAQAATLARDPRGMAMTGAAGGLAGGLWGALGAALEPGAPYVLDVLGFDERLRNAACVITGEGRIDEQSAMGKIVGEIAARARRARVPAYAVVGCDDLGPERADALGLAAVVEATTLDELAVAGEHLARATAVRE